MIIELSYCQKIQIQSYNIHNDYQSINSVKSVIDVLIINIIFPEIFNKFNFECAWSYNFSNANGKSVSSQMSSIKEWLWKWTTRIKLKVSYTTRPYTTYI